MTITEVPRPMLWTARPDLTDSNRFYLDSFGPIEEMKYSHQPTGSKSMEAKLVVPVNFTHSALTPGRACGITVGAEDVWTGTLAEPDLNDDGSRTLSGIGDSLLPKNFLALSLASQNALDPNEIIDAANLSGRHARFYRVSTLPMPAGAYAQDASFMMDEALTQITNAQGKQWRVDRDRCIRFYDPSVGDGRSYILKARQDIGRTTDDIYSRLSGAYIDALTGLYRVEHADVDYGENGGTFYPDFYNAGITSYAQRTFTIYSDGTTVVAYVMQAPATAVTMQLSSGQTLTKVASSQFYTQFSAAGAASVGTGGRTATYKDAGNVAVGTGAQSGYSHPGLGSLYATEFIAPREGVVDLSSSGGSYTLSEVVTQLRAALVKQKTQPHYTGSFTVAPGDLTNTGGVPVDLASVRSLCQVQVIVIDPTRNLGLNSDSAVIIMGETEYDVDTGSLSMTPFETPSVTQPQRFIDPLTGLYR